MSSSDDAIFVLWGNGFDEAAAAVFVTAFRRVGLRVKVVGLSQRPSSGTYGLALLPDVTLEQAMSLASKAVCLVVPYTSSGSKRLGNDPRLQEFFQKLHTNQARFIIGQLDEAELDLFPGDIDRLVMELNSEDLIRIAHDLAQSFSIDN